MSRIFISHSSRNNAQALALAQWLESNGLGDYFLDIHEDRGITAGERWMAALSSAVDRCEAVVFLASPAWLESKYCFAEFFKAKELGKRIFGVIVEPIELAQLPGQMTAEWQVCNLTPSDSPVSFDVARVPIVPRCTVQFSSSGLTALLKGLRKAGLDPTTFVWPPLDDVGRSPYPGLRALDEPDAAVFFGRESSIVRAIDQLRRARERGIEQVFVILGASGAGKSSFLRAGLLPRLRRDNDHFVVLPTLRCERAAMSGAAGLLETIKKALASVGIDRSIAQLRDDLQAKGLADLLRTMESTGASAADEGARHSRTVVIPIDQAEELFAAEGRIEAEAFLQLLKAACDESRTSAVSHSPDRLRIMLLPTIRADSLTALQRYPVFAQDRAALFSLSAMPIANFRSVIEGPARRHSEAVKPVNIEPQLVEKLIWDAQGADALPLLALTLEWLYREFTTRDGAQLGLDQYRTIGGVRGVIGAAVRNAFDRPQDAPAIPIEGKERDKALADIFARIVTVDPDTGQAKRRIATRDSLRVCGPAADGIVSRLVEQRLLSSDTFDAEGPAKSEVIEVAHEALLRQWDLLENWLRMQAVDLAVIEAVRRAAIEWQRGNCDRALLVHTSHRLKAAESLLAGSQLSVRFETGDKDYLAACRERDERELQDREDKLRRIALEQGRRSRIQKQFVLVLIAAAAITGAFSIWTVVQRREVSRQVSLMLASASESAADQKEFARAVRLGILAAKSGMLSPSHRTAIPALVRAMDANPLRLVLRHSTVVLNAAFSGDGRRVVTIAGNTARIWGARTGEPIGEPMRAGGSIKIAAFDPDGTHVVTASDDKTARIWDTSTGNALGEPMKHDSLIDSVTFNPDGTRVVTASGRTVRIWDSKTGKALGEPMKLDNLVNEAAFSPDGTQIVTASLDETARIWDVNTRVQLGKPMVHDQPVISAAFIAHGARVVTSALGGTVRIWDTKTDKPIGEPMVHAEPVRRITFSPDRTRIVTLAGHSARIWDANTGTPLGVPINHEDTVNSAAFSADGTRIVTASDDHTARIWDANTGKPLGEWMKHEGNVNTAAFSSDDRIVTASNDFTAQIWDASIGKPIGEPMRAGISIHIAAFYPDGTRIVTIWDETAQIWDANNGKPLGKPTKYERKVVALSPDGTRIVTMENGDGRNLRTRDAKTGRALGRSMMHQEEFESVAFSPDGRRIVTTAGGTAQMWDTNTGQALGESMEHEEEVFSAAFSPDGSRIVTTSAANSTARIWDANTGKLLRGPLKLGAPILRHALSPNGTRIVTASDDYIARIWDINTGEEVGEPMKHGGSIVDVAAFSPNGRLLVAGSDDHTARIWDANTGKPAGEPLKHDGDVSSVAFSLDGRRIVTTAGHVSRIWDANTGKALSEPRQDDQWLKKAVFSPDGTRIMTISFDTARLWSAKLSALASRPDILIATACGSMNKEARQISQDDRQNSTFILADVDDVCEGITFEEPK